VPREERTRTDNEEQLQRLAATSSDRIGSGIHGSGPIGRPIVLDRSQMPIVAPFARALIVYTITAGRKRTAIAHAISKAAARMKKNRKRAVSSRCSGTTAAWIRPAAMDEIARMIPRSDVRSLERSTRVLDLIEPSLSG
jgi:hypothetical protein